MDATAPYCPASPRADGALRSRLDGLTGTLVDALGDDALAVVLGGSLARGQGMVLATPDGPRVLSDVDLYVVRSRPQPDRERVLQRELREAMRSDGLVLAPLDLAFVAPDHFEGLGDTLPARQLAIATRVLHERSGADWARPDRVGAADGPVDPDDAHRLLLNRMAETLLLDDADPWFAAVHRAKRWIDAPLAWLAARGRYHPDRRVQLDRLESLGRTWESDARERLDAGIEVARTWLDAIATRELEPAWLSAWPGVDGRANLSPDPVRDWVGAFARALFHGPGRETGADLHEAFASGRGVERDVVRRWLQRRSLPARLRQARRWHPLAPVAVRPWWSYGPGGSGEERVYAAAALRHAGDEQWRWPLEGLLRTPLDDDVSALGRLWADWILGGGRR